MTIVLIPLTQQVQHRYRPLKSLMKRSAKHLRQTESEGGIPYPPDAEPNM